MAEIDFPAPTLMSTPLNAAQLALDELDHLLTLASDAADKADDELCADSTRHLAILLRAAKARAIELVNAADNLVPRPAETEDCPAPNQRAQ